MTRLKPSIHLVAPHFEILPEANIEICYLNCVTVLFVTATVTPLVSDLGKTCVVGGSGCPKKSEPTVWFGALF